MSNTLLDYDFPQLTYGTKETPHKLSFLLYRGAAGQRRDKRNQFIKLPLPRAPDLKRVSMIEQIHTAICYFIALGRSRITLESYLTDTYRFFSWCDFNNRDATEESIVSDYKTWSDYLWHKSHVSRSIKPRSAYGYLSSVDTVISEALGIPMGILRLTRFGGLGFSSNELGTKSDEIDTNKCVHFGEFLLDVTLALTEEKIYGSLPIEIPLRTGNKLIEWCKLKPPDNLKTLHPDAFPTTRARAISLRDAWEADRSHKTRYSVINLRVEAELLIFISQTGMNLAQAHKLKKSDYKFKSTNDKTAVYEVYKGRRSGKAVFWIFSAYESIFSNYLQWLDKIFGIDEPKLFPFIHPDHVPRKDRAPTLQAIVLRSKRAEIEYIGPRALRSIRSNWLLRRSDNPDLSAEMSQHTKAVMFKNYIRPQFSVAAAEITRFHNAVDPAVAPPGPGICVGLGTSPLASEEGHTAAPIPDCVNPAGCMFCFHHRDINNQDYVWLLATYRECKSLELDRLLPTKTSVEDHPALHVISKIDAKLVAFRNTGTGSIWVDEAYERIKEGRFHPMFDGLIKLMELGS